MKKTIGPSFVDELSMAGLLGLPFAWSADGDINFGSDLSREQRAAVEKVYLEHDPKKLGSVEIREQIFELEKEGDRTVREALLALSASGVAFPDEVVARLQNIEDRIAELKAKL